MALMDGLFSYPPAFQRWAQQNPQKVAEAGDLSSAFNEWQLPTVGGKQYYSAPDQASVPGAWSDMIGNSQITLPDGRTAIPNDIAKQIAQITNKNDPIGNILNGPGALALAFGPAAAGIAAGGLAGGAAAGGADALGAELAGYWNPATSGIGGSSLTGGAVGADATWPVNQRGGDLYNALDFDQAAMDSGVTDASGYGTAQGTTQTFSGLPTTTSWLNGLPGAPGGGSSESSFLDGLSKAFPNTNLGSLLGSLGAAGLGYLGANKQEDAYKDVANQYMNLGAPYRDKLNASYQPGFDLQSQPGYGDAFKQTADTAARSYSAQSGNPADQPSAQGGILNSVWSQNYLPALSNYRGQLGQFGGLGLNTSGAASLGGAQQAGGGYDALGYGLSQITNPQTSLEELLKKFSNGSGNYKLTGY